MIFIKRLLQRLYLFYAKRDYNGGPHYFNFFYTIGAFALFIVFYVTGMLQFSGRINVAEDYYLFVGIAFCIISINMYFFFKRRKKIEADLLKNLKLQFDWLDVFVILYIVISFGIFIGSTVYLKNTLFAM